MKIKCDCGFTIETLKYVQCKECGVNYQVTAEDERCPNCGSGLNFVICPSCGQILRIKGNIVSNEQFD